MNFLIAQTLSLFPSPGKRNHLLYNKMLHAKRHPEKGQDLRIFLPRHFSKAIFLSHKKRRIPHGTRRQGEGTKTVNGDRGASSEHPCPAHTGRPPAKCR